MGQLIKFNISTIQYALRNNLHVEYFIQCYLKTINDAGIYYLNDIRINYDDKKCFSSKLKKHFNCVLKEKMISSGAFCKEEIDDVAKKVTIDLLNKNCFKKYTFEKHLSDNVFFSISKEKIFIKNNKKNKTETKHYNFICDFEEATFMAQKEATYSKKMICGWNETLIKYFFIAIWSSQYKDTKPYALDLISQDLCISVSTIQKAIKVFEVMRKHGFQEKASLRSYGMSNQRVNLTPNYMNMSFGAFACKKKTRI